MSGNEVAHLIEDIDGYLCELGMAQIRDGLHMLGDMPPLPDTLRALTRLPNGGVPGVQAALAHDVWLRPRAAARGARRAPRSRTRATSPARPCSRMPTCIERLESARA